MDDDDSVTEEPPYGAAFVPMAIADELVTVPFEPAGEMSGARGNLVRGSAYSVVGLVLTGLSGALFWLVAARLYPSVAVGRASALFTSVLLVNFLSNLGLPVALARFGHGPDGDGDVVFTWALVAMIVASAVAAVVFFLVVDPHAVAAVGGRSGAAIALFTALVVGTSMTLLVDVRLMLAREWRFVLLRMAAVGVVRLPLLWARPPVADALWLFVLAAGFPAVSGAVGLFALRRVAGARFGLRPRPSALGAFARFAAVNYVATLAVDAARFVLPVMVLVTVPASANASFYVAWSVAMLIFLAPATIGQVLLVEASRTSTRRSPILAAGSISVGLMATASIGAWVRADVITSLFGAGYRPAAEILPRLMAAGVPWAITSVTVADARVRGDTRSTLGITGTLGLAVLVPAAILVPEHGIRGAADAWLGGHLVTAGVSAVLLIRSRVNRPAGAGASVP
ncbi:MAG: hypothetical protein QOE35_3494 [Actinomycetota bacterium]|jgi:O-antigen/teichoic acid export membrane protein